MTKSMKTLVLTAAISGLLGGASAATTNSTQTFPQKSLGSTNFRLNQTADDKHSCKGKNSCKGKGGCNTGDNGCKGKNSCKGKGGCNTSRSMMMQS